jgi:outer membrane protein assembly factor BamB
MIAKYFPLALLGAFASVSLGNEDWPRWGGPRGDGTWHGEGIPDVLDDDAIGRVWKKDIGGGYSGITVEGGRVYTMDYQKAPNERERVLCFDSIDGRLLWEHAYAVDYNGLDYGSGPRASVTLHEGRAYSLGAVGHVRCLNAETGKVVWEKDSTKELEAERPTWGFAASPAIWKDLVIYHLGLPGGSYVAFDRKTGAEIWRGSEDPAGYGTPVFAEHAGQPLMVAWTPEHVQGLSPDTGEVFWSIPYKVKYGVSIATPLVRDGIVLVCGYWHGSRAIRLGDDTPREATLLWSDEENLRGLMAPPLYREGNVYLLDREKGVTCFDLATGKPRWNDAADHAVTPADRNPQASLVWVGAPGTDRALAVNANGELLSLRLTPEKQEILSRAQVVGKTWAHPAYAGNHLYARSDREIVCWRIGEK